MHSIYAELITDGKQEVMVLHFDKKEHTAQIPIRVLSVTIGWTFQHAKTKAHDKKNKLKDHCILANWKQQAIRRKIKNNGYSRIP